MTPVRIAAASVALAAAALATAPATGAAAQPVPLAEAAEDPAAWPILPVVEQWAAAWNAYDAEGMAALFIEDGVCRDEAFQATFTGRGGIADWVEITAAAIPEAELEVIDAFRAGDRVAVRWVFHGTPDRFGPLAAADRSFSVPAVTIMDLEDGLIAQLTDTYNLADVFRQAGLDARPWVPPNP